MRVLIIGVLSGELGRAALMASQRGASVDQVDRPDQALERLRRDAGFDLVLCEISFDIGSLVGMLLRERFSVGVVACGCDADPEQAAAAIRAGAKEFLPLPPDPELIAAILEAASSSSHTLLARDPAMLAVLRRSEQIAASDASVMISGESGTGKEVLARHIHARSRRARGPFVALNCAAIPEHLLESELFGHEKGAFSGAVARRIGKFEAAGGGTLLLDEISEMDVRLQSKLLRAIQEREIDRLGGTSPVRVDVRILATTNREMRTEIGSGRFRPDLYFRLNVVSVTVPPLRARAGDVAILARHYAQHYSRVNGLQDRRPSDDAMRLLVNYGWPGNVRELENTMHRAVLLSDSEEIGIDAIELADLSGRPSEPMVGAAQGGELVGDRAVAQLVGRSVDDVERALIIETLSHTAGNRTHAATILGISIRALRNKLRDYSSQGVAVPAPASGTAFA